MNTPFKTWLSFSGSYVIGFAFYEEKMLSGDELVALVKEAIAGKILDDVLRRLNGNFSLIIEERKACYLIADKMRSYPILYTKKENHWLISDDAEKIMTDNAVSKETDTQSIYEFLAAGYLSGNKTLLKNVRQVVAGTYVCLEENECRITEYHNYAVCKTLLEEDEIIKGAEIALERAFGRLFESIGNRQIVIPLSGGYDSRLIACMCKRHNIKNVICYSYGRPDSFEAEISRKVAEQLGFQWLFVEYTPELIGSFKKDADFIKYLGHAHHLNTLPHFQDYFAVRELKARDVLEKDAVFVPGHSGDLLGGSKLPVEVFNEEFSLNTDSLVKLIYEHFFDLNKEKYNDRDKCCRLIFDQLKENKVDTRDELLDIYESYWFIKSKVSHLLVNSMRIYEYFGFDWRLPLWDDEYATFWYRVGWEKKIASQLYNRFMFDTYFTPFNVAYRKNNRVKRLIPPVIKKCIPDCFLTFLRLIYMRLHKQKYDFNAQSQMSFLFKKLNKKIDHFCIDAAYDTNSIAVIYMLNRIMIQKKSVEKVDKHNE